MNRSTRPQLDPPPTREAIEKVFPQIPDGGLDFEMPPTRREVPVGAKPSIEEHVLPAVLEVLSSKNHPSHRYGALTSTSSSGSEIIAGVPRELKAGYSGKNGDTNPLAFRQNDVGTESLSSSFTDGAMGDPYFPHQKEKKDA